MGRLQIVRKDAWVPESLKQRAPESGLGRYVRSILRFLPGVMGQELLERVMRSTVMESALQMDVYRLKYPELVSPTPLRHPWAYAHEPLGVVCNRVVTWAGVQFIVDAFQGSTELELFRYHAIGSGFAAEAAADTALEFEFGEHTNPGSLRQAGTLTEGGSNNVFRTVATTTATGAIVVREHGIFTSSTRGGGTLLDRSTFLAINLANGDSLQSTFDLLVSAGG
jgi:hypothetical protein